MYIAFPLEIHLLQVFNGLSCDLMEKFSAFTKILYYMKNKFNSSLKIDYILRIFKQNKSPFLRMDFLDSYLGLLINNWVNT